LGRREPQDEEIQLQGRVLPSRRAFELREDTSALHDARNGKGAKVYHTFSCTLAAPDKVWHLYVVAQPRGKFGLHNDLKKRPTGD
jgi:hypothetical protein